MIGTISVKITGYPTTEKAWILYWFDAQSNQWVPPYGTAPWIDVKEALVLNGVTLDHFACYINTWNPSFTTRYPAGIDTTFEITGPYSPDLKRVLKNGATYTLNINTGKFTESGDMMKWLLIGSGIAAVALVTSKMLKHR